MDWSILLYLLCPLMMIFCMKGMHGGHNHNAKNECEQTSMSAQDLQSMSAKLTELTEQNASLLKEVQTLKEEMSALTAGQKIY